MKRTPLAMAALLIAVALSGCAEPAAEPNEVDDVLAGALDEAGLTADSSVPAPEWSVGQYYGHHIFFGADDTAGTHINTVVVANEGSTYRLLTDNRDLAEIEALFDIPILGEINKGDLATTAFGGPWDVFDFPLQDGKTWQASITAETDQFLEPITRDVTMTATFNPEVEMPGSSKTFPGFDLVGELDGEVLFETNFVPEIGWYASFRYYDLETEEPEDYLFFVRSMGYGQDFASALGGVVYDLTAVPHIRHISVSIGPEGNAGSAHLESFEVSEGSLELVGFQFVFAAVAGEGSSHLVDPNGNAHGYQAAALPNGADPMQWGGGDGTPNNQFDRYASVPGEWQYMQQNAGVVSGGGAFIWEIFEEQVIL